jgi:hypothetical protein
MSVAFLMTVTSVFSLIAAISVAAVTPVVTAVAVIAFTINRHIFIVIPAILYKIHRIIAGVVTSAIAAPVFSVARRNAQIKRFVHIYMAMHDDRSVVNHAWYRVGIIANIYAAIKAWLAYADRYAYICGQRCPGTG